jgi:phosphatidylserine/phosphatidylglycerophosphate/cardiolipin synthase-like enzyme/uncharacterized membrane protein YdjX (TVP38/TMEM64 family)
MAALSTRSMSTRPTLFDPGRNCWRVERARRAAFIVDADAYFKAFVEAARHAERSILIAGWDFHSRTRLLCSHDNAHAGEKQCELELGDFLNELARTRRELQIHILIWDYPMIFGLDREWGPTYGWGWKPHRRIHFRYDNTHPIGGSHHQKIVVIDDTIAFNGGIDLTCRRWDTTDHAPDNEHRTMRGTPYPPFHDVMMVVEGDAALALGNLVRERWHEATKDTIQPSRPRRRIFRRSADAKSRDSRWPASIEPTMRDIDVAISRTKPPVNGTPGVREIEALYLDMIASARHSIYIENQYFTADRIGDALAERLAEPDGPEVIIVLRELSHGWLEEVTMQTLRTRLIEKLRAADAHGRFRVYYPYIAGLKEGTCIDVHSKMIVIDDELARVGSANLANRSMGLDTECDLTVEARDREDVREVIRNLRACLLAEHLGTSLEKVRSAIDSAGNLREAIDGLPREDRTLKPLAETPQVSETVLAMISVADPEKPVELGDLAKLFTPETEPTSENALVSGAGPAWGKLVGGALVLVALTALWKLTPLATFLDANLITSWARRAGSHWVTPILTILAYTPAALTMFPRPLITLFAVIAFGPLLGFAYAMLGIELSAWVTFVAGQRLSRETVRRVAGEKLAGILNVLRKRGLIAMTALRLVPLAPFAVEGVVAGAVRVKLSDFMIGTALGILPGTLASTVFGDQLQVWLENPSQINYWLIAGVLGLLAGATWYVRRWLIASSERSRSGANDARTV